MAALVVKFSSHVFLNSITLSNRRSITVRSNFFIMLLYHVKSNVINRSGRPEVFLGKTVPEICSKLTGEHPCRSVTSISHRSHDHRSQESFTICPEEITLNQNNVCVPF